MKCPRWKDKDAAMEPGCRECANYFFGECNADAPSFIYRLPTVSLSIFRVEMKATIRRSASVLIYAKNEEAAQDAVDSDLEKDGILSDYLDDDSNDDLDDIEADVDPAPDEKKACLVAYGDKVFTVNNFKKYVDEKGFDEDEEIPLIAEA